VAERPGGGGPGFHWPHPAAPANKEPGTDNRNHGDAGRAASRWAGTHYGGAVGTRPGAIRGGDPLAELRKLCLALPETTERLSHGEPAWFVRERKTFVSFADHHHDDRLACWCAAPPGAQEELIAADPARYFRPPYVGARGWLGVYLDVEVDWAELAEIVTEAYRTVAPKTLVRQLDEA
jgi:hypothetical protein